MKNSHKITVDGIGKTDLVVCANLGWERDVPEFLDPYETNPLGPRHPAPPPKWFVEWLIDSARNEEFCDFSRVGKWRETVVEGPTGIYTFKWIPKTVNHSPPQELIDAAVEGDPKFRDKVNKVRREGGFLFLGYIWGEVHPLVELRKDFE